MIIAELQNRLGIFGMLKNQFIFDKKAPNPELGLNSDAEWKTIKDTLQIYTLCKEIFRGRSTQVEATETEKKHNVVNIEEMTGLIREIRIKINLIM